MKRIILFVAVVALFSANSAFALSLTIENKTGKELHELYFAPAGDDDWGPDQLDKHTVPNDDTFTLTKIEKGKYDVLFVDEKGEKCDIRNVDFTSSELFVMTKEIIKGCQAATAKAEKEEAEEEESEE